MATETNHPSKSLVAGLSFIAGAGLMLMVTVAAVGAIQGEAASSPESLGLLFALGVALLVGGVGAWLAVVRPFTHFDDINQPAPDEHHHGAHAEPHASETALAVAPPADLARTH